MTILGMDVGTMSELVERFDRAANELSAVSSAADSQIRLGTSVWFGGEAELFAHVWSSRHRVAMLALQSELTGLVTTLRNEIAQQQRASSSADVRAAFAAGLSALRLGQSQTYANGSLRMTHEANYSTTGPRNVKDLLSGLLYSSGNDKGQRAYDYPGGISVLLEGSPPNRHVIVSISGTESWTVGGKNPSDFGGDIQNLAGLHTAKEAAIQQALLASGVTHADHVMLVGHSQGGADALAFAHDNDNNKFDIQSVVTVGAPPESKWPPKTVQVLQLEGSGDLVPYLGRQSAHTNQSVVGVRDSFFDDPLSAHDPSTYAEHLNESNPAVQSFEHKQVGFFGGQPATTSVYSNVRTSTDPALEVVSSAVVPDLTAASAVDAGVRSAASSADAWIRRTL